MAPIRLTDPATGSTARVLPDLGFNCYHFAARFGGRVVDVLYADPDFGSGHLPPTKHGIPILFPFPNRIREGHYTWDGREYVLPPDRVGYNGIHAIHGFCLDRPWRVVAQGDGFAEGEFQLSRDAPERLPLWPTDFTIRVRYELRGATLTAKFRVANPDTKPLPWGLGTHPYFRVPLAPDSGPDQCLIEAPAPELWQLVDCLPTGDRTPVPADKNLQDGARFSALKLDDVLTGVPNAAPGWECLIMDEKAGLQVVQRADSLFRECVAFTPPHREAVCLEPYTCITDAVNLQARGIDAGWRTLDPGQEVTTWIEIRAESVIV